jgi:HSP20 family protein
VDQLFDYAFGQALRAQNFGRGAAGPALEVFEDKDNITVRAELPGLKKEEIQINLQDGILAISGERRRDEKQNAGQGFRSERLLTRFHRTVSLPAEVNPETIKATYTDGILAVTLPKSEKAKPRQIPISVN